MVVKTYSCLENIGSSIMKKISYSFHRCVVNERQFREDVNKSTEHRFHPFIDRADNSIGSIGDLDSQVWGSSNEWWTHFIKHIIKVSHLTDTYELTRFGPSLIEVYITYRMEIKHQLVAITRVGFSPHCDKRGGSGRRANWTTRHRRQSTDYSRTSHICV